MDAPLDEPASPVAIGSMVSLASEAWESIKASALEFTTMGRHKMTSNEVAVLASLAMQANLSRLSISAAVGRSNLDVVLTRKNPDSSGSALVSTISLQRSLSYALFLFVYFPTFGTHMTPKVPATQPTTDGSSQNRRHVEAART